ncbi:hypothetical protein M9H77_20486 [Catharanthus roseus]|uniref:Uncharacterized protein n=1 Tax=Catharanthus roseus TaxID=4058 RepID=A0ACC0AP04_CATRO|nr:hypothetical protein M9H77_20486 [Catharanthus roseus]
MGAIMYTSIQNPHRRTSKQSFDMASSTKKFEELISTLPADTDYHVCQYRGFWFPMLAIDRILQLQEEETFKCKETDILICSSPKTGFTWLKSLCIAISTRTSSDELTNPLRNNLPHDIIPLLELHSHTHYDDQLPFYSTHLPFSLLPESIKSLSSGCKIIYICRDPKDAFVSLWHFFNKIWIQQPIEVCFQGFCEGKTGFGPYWDHVLEYWNASTEMPAEKILFLKYEDLKKDNLFYVRRIAEFIGKPFSIKEEEDGVVEKIAKFCSFESMSSLEVNKREEVRPFGSSEAVNSAFFRKGSVGDWKSFLTAEMVEKIDEITEKKMSGSGFNFGSSD